MHRTQNDLPQSTRSEIAQLLNARLADAIALSLQAKQAHWNVKGPTFLSLHELFDKVHGLADGFVDELAERLVALGGQAEGTAQVVAQKSTLPVYPLEISAGQAHVTALSASLAAFGKHVRSAIDLSTELKDAGTADLFTGISREADQYLWLLEAHLEK